MLGWRALVIAARSQVTCRARSRLSSRAPSPAHPLAIRFADKVELIGYDVGPLGGKPPAPEQTFKLTWYWKVLAPLGEGYQVFTHVADAAGRTQLNLDAERAMRAAYPEAQWKAGDFIKDVQPVTLPRVSSPELASIWVSTRRKRWMVQRPADGERRRCAALPIARSSPPRGELSCPACRKASRRPPRSTAS